MHQYEMSVTGRNSREDHGALDSKGKRNRRLAKDEEAAYEAHVDQRNAPLDGRTQRTYKSRPCLHRIDPRVANLQTDQLRARGHAIQLGPVRIVGGHNPRDVCAVSAAVHSQHNTPSRVHNVDGVVEH